MIVWHKNAEMWWVSSVSALVGAPFGRFELNSNFSKFHSGWWRSCLNLNCLKESQFKSHRLKFQYLTFEIALYNVRSILGRGQTIIGGPKVLFKGQNSVTPRQQETAAILDTSSLWSVIQSEVLTLLLQKKMHSLVLMFEAAEQTVGIQCSAGADGTRFSPIIASPDIFGLPCGNNNDSDMEKEAFHLFNNGCFKAISVVL